ncbi:MAG: cytochrome c biogenesis protein ResB [Deltaproteobacteria bacterium]|nr:cytochrome c biogenesis protein ResB [Deltaproteobacteria bacterium]
MAGKHSNWLYRKLSSMRVSVYLVGVLSLLYSIGTIFPQGADMKEYTNAGGRFLGAVRFFNLLDVFNTPWFLIPASILFLNTLVCAYDRFLGLRARKKAFPGTFIPQMEIPLPLGKTEAEGAVSDILQKNLGFKRPKSGPPPSWTVVEKGLSYRWLTWLYHAGIAVCFAGFMLSGLFVREGVITLEPGRPEPVISASPEKTGWLVRKDHPPPPFEIVLDEFVTEYAESPGLEYPKDKLSRLAVWLGWKELSYKMGEEPLIAKDWFSKLRVIKNNRTEYEKTIEVNSPLKFEGYTFYQEAYEQTLKLKVRGEPGIIEAKTGERVEIPSMGAKLEFGTLRNGTVLRLAGASGRIKPFVSVDRVVQTPEGTDGKEPYGKLEAGGSITINGHELVLTGFKEASVLSYRYDPGVPVIWIAGSFVLVVMALRCFGAWYLLAYSIEERDGRMRLSLSIKTKGLYAEPQRIMRGLTRGLRALS